MFLFCLNYLNSFLLLPVYDLELTVKREILYETTFPGYATIASILQSINQVNFEMNKVLGFFWKCVSLLFMVNFH